MPITRKPLDDAIEEYAAYRASHGDAPNTIRNNVQVLRKGLQAWGNVFVQDIGPQHISRLFSQYNWAASTRNQYRSTLLTFFKWARNCSYAPLDHDPMNGWGTVRVPRVEAFRLPPEEFDDLLDATTHPRDRAIVALALYTLSRGSEIASLQICDVDLDNGMLHLYRHKTKDEDWLPMSNELRRELVAWLNWYRKDQGKLLPNWYLVPAKDKAQWKPAGQRQLVRVTNDEHLRPEVREKKPYRAVQRAMVKLGYDPKGSGVHTCRRSGARALADSSRDLGIDNTLLLVGSVMGHLSTNTTQKYIGWNGARMERNEWLKGKDMYRKAAPKPDATISELKEKSRRDTA